MRREIFPQEVTGSVPRITLTGTGRLQVEQHQGLVGYRQEEVLLRTSCGVLRVTGGALRFQAYSAGDALLVGRIETVTLEHEGSAR